MQKTRKGNHSVPSVTQLPSRQILVSLEGVQKNPAFIQATSVTAIILIKTPVARIYLFAWSLELPV